MSAFLLVIGLVITVDVPGVRFAEHDEVFKAFLASQLHPAYRESVQVWSPRADFLRLNALGLQDRVELGSVLVIVVAISSVGRSGSSSKNEFIFRADRFSPPRVRFGDGFCTGSQLTSNPDGGSGLKHEPTTPAATSPRNASSTSTVAPTNSLGARGGRHYDEEDDAWTCNCTKHMLASYDGIVASQRELDEICRPFGGFTDGRGTFGNADDE